MLSSVLQKGKVLVRSSQHKFDIKRISQMPPIDEVDTLHLSFDDVHQVFINASKPVYQSVFEQPFLCQLKKFHDEYGAKFTLYCLEDPSHRLHDRYCREISEAGWLKIGYHADVNGTVSLEGYQMFSSYYLNKEVPLANTIRLHMFSAPEKLIKYFEAEGNKTLLCSDDSRISYGISPNLYLGGYQNNGIRYVPTDLRLEKVISGVVCHKKKLVVFAHERPFMIYKEFEKLKELLRLFINVQYELD